MLLQKGASHSLTAEDGTAPLHVAAQNGHRSTTEILLKHGADPNSANQAGKLPLHAAAQHGHAGI
eukprot:6258325-Prorocentrum_lima.AAC.1